MLTAKRTLLVLTLVLALAAPFALAEVPKTISYQGRLTDVGGPVTATVAMTFTIYDAVTVGNSKWTEIHPSVSVVDGLFNVILGAGTPPVPIEDTVFSGADRWLEISVGAETITPRTKLASDPYAFQSNWTRVGRVLYTSGQWGIARAGNTLHGYGDSSHVNLGRVSTTGLSGSDHSYATVSGGHNNFAEGSSSTVSGGSTNQASGGLSTVGGGYANAATMYASTAAGGYSNKARAIYSTVGGGDHNIATGDHSTIGGGDHDTASGDWSTVGGGDNNKAGGGASTVGGGQSNEAIGSRSAVGGGYDNTADGAYSTVAGGTINEASAFSSTVGGGHHNIADGNYSTVAGGVLNTASGDHSFAAGRRAKAVHDGAFVWADSTDADFSSTDHNQFLIRASGGVGIGTSSPSEQLDVAGHVLVKGLDGFDANGEVANLYLGDGENYVRATYAGGMSIGTFGGLATKFFVGGVEIFNVSGGGVCWYGSSGSCSDRRFKKDITSITHALDQVSRLHGITHTWRVDEFPTKGFAEGEQFGFIAQDVQEILPSLVSNDGDGYLYVDYAKVTPLLVEAVKELSVENDDLKAQIAQLTSLVETVLANQQEANSHGSDELASK